MNLFEKMKLRAMLRNCNYELAATVLKQQYYEEGKNTELNRMIDALIETPNFDTALKLIQYNDMFVFYFTESCHDGLYVRKQTKEPAFPRQADALQGAPAASTASPAGTETPAEAVAARDEAPAARPAPSPVELLEERFAELEAAVAREASALRSASARREEDSYGEAGTDARDGRHGWEGRDVREPREMRDARGRSLLDEPERRTAVRETAAEPAARAVKEPAFRPAGELSARPVKEMPLRPVGETPARSVGDPPSPKVSISERNTERGERSAAEDAGKDGLKESIKESIKKLVRDPSAGDAEMPPAAGRKPQPQPVLEPEEPPAASLEAEPIDPERSRYRNVISTLLIDIEEMKRQREEYQQYIFNNAPDAVKYKRWVVSLDEAIEEFTGAARILSRYRK